MLRANLGCDPLDTWSRTRSPALNRYAVGHISTTVWQVPSGCGAVLSGVSRMIPSQMLVDLPLRSTSQRRQKKSLNGRLDRVNSSTLTVPTISMSSSNGSVV